MLTAVFLILEALMDLKTIKKLGLSMRILAGVIGVTLLAVYFLWFVILNNQPLSKLAGDWGAFGDFIGGILNPLVGFFAFWWLTKSVLVQKEELEDTRKALIEASNAQKEQAKTAAIKAKLHVISMRLDHIKISLGGELDYRNNLLDGPFNHASSFVGSYSSYDGINTNGQELLAESNVKINIYHKEQNLLIKNANELLEAAGNP